MTLSQKSFTDIYDTYVDKIYRFVFLRVNSKVTAQDLTSETFTRTLEYHKRNPDVQIENMQAFLYRTARNIVTVPTKFVALPTWVSTPVASSYW